MGRGRAVHPIIPVTDMPQEATRMAKNKITNDVESHSAGVIGVDSAELDVPFLEELGIIEPEPDDETTEPEPVPNDGIEPGSPEFDWQHEYPGEKFFVYTNTDGVTVGLAALLGARKPKPGYLRKLRKQNELDVMWTIIEMAASPAALDVSDEFEDEDYGKMYAAWSEWNQTTVGESMR